MTHPSFSLASGFHAVVIGGAGDIGAAITNMFCDLGATATATGVDDADIARTQLEPREGLTLAPLDALASPIRHGGFRERRHARVNRARGTHQRQRECGPRAFAEPQVEVEQGARVKRVQHDAMSLLR